MAAGTLRFVGSGLRVAWLAWCGGMLAAALGVNARASEWSVDGGTLEIAGTVQADTLRIGAAGALEGAGLVQGSGDVAGVLVPGSAAATGTLAFSGNLRGTPGSVFRCRARTHTDVAGIQVGGAAFGSFSVEVAAASNAVPVDVVILRAEGASDLSGFGAADPARWRVLEGSAGQLWLTDRAGDSDADGLPDWWELVYAASRTNAIPGDDPDHDGANNLAEQRAGTDPTNRVSVLAVTALARSGSAATLDWESAAGRVYSVRAATAVALPFSRIVASNVAATPPVNRVALPAEGTNTAAFYRIQLDSW